MKTTGLDIGFLSEGGDQAAVDDEVGPGDVRRAVAGEHEHEVPDLVGAGEPAGHALRGDPGPDVRRLGPTGLGDGGRDAVAAEPQVRLDRTWADGVDPDPARPELLRQRLAHVAQGRLRRAV